MEETNGKSRRGFASMSPEKKREVARKGGKTAWAKGTANKWTHETAQKAGRIGGQLSRRGPTIKHREEGESHGQID